MSFKVTISDNPQIFSKCIEAIDFQVDTPNDSFARSTDIDNVIEITGEIGTEEPTSSLYLWSLLPPNDPKAYRNVEIQVISHQGMILRKVVFSNAFVVDYRESFSKYTGEGSFVLVLRQKKDKNDTVKIEGELAEDSWDLNDA